LKVMVKASTHHSGVPRRSGMAVILSVTEAKLCPGSMTGAFSTDTSLSTRFSSWTSTGVIDPLRLFHLEHGAMVVRNLGIRIDHRRQIGGARTRIQLRHQPVVALRTLPLHHPALRIIDIAECDGIGRARLLTSGHQFIADARLAGLIFLRLDAAAIDALHAVR